MLCYDPQFNMWYIQRGLHIEEVFPMTLEYIKDQQEENAKLRELVEDMLSCIEIRAAFGRPPTDEMYETFVQRARELGMEVDG
jgi:hypothetical protein